MRRLNSTVVLTAAAMVFGAARLPARAAEVSDPAQPAAAVHPTIVTRGAITGQRQRIAFLYQVNPSCSPEGIPAIHTLSAPQHGRLEAIAGDKYPYFAANSQLVECNLHTVSGIVLYYTSSAGFQGEDSVMLSMIYPDGARYVVRYQITVESAG